MTEEDENIRQVLSEHAEKIKEEEDLMGEVVIVHRQDELTGHTNMGFSSISGETPSLTTIRSVLTDALENIRSEETLELIRHVLTEEKEWIEDILQEDDSDE